MSVRALAAHRSIRHKLGAVVFSIGAVTLFIIALTYWTLAGLADDNDREEIARSQETTVFHHKLLTLDLLRGEDVLDEIAAEEQAYELLLRRLEVSGTTNDASHSDRLAASWEGYRAATSAVIAAHRALRISADDALGRFAPWLSSLAMLEAYVDPDDDFYEDHLGLLADCRTASSSLSNSFFKLTTAPPGDPERQSRLSLSVATETISDILEELRSGLAAPAHASKRSEYVLDGLIDAQAAWEALSHALDQVADAKGLLGQKIGPSDQPNLDASFDAIMVEQREALRRYEALAESRQRLLSRLLIVSALVVIALAAVATLVIKRSIVDPIHRLTAGTVVFAAGDLSARIVVESRDEIGILAESFNGMAGSLAASRRELEKWADTLELQVKERTEELREANARLVEEGCERARMEDELRLAQKLESVGQLAAGVAHEINTPIQFVGDNTRFVQEFVGKLGPVVEKVKELATQCAGAGAADCAKELLALIESADIDYMLRESELAVGQSLEGIERVAKIVRAMKEFSHPGVDEMTFIDLRHAIESTVTVATNEWKYVAEVTLDIAPDLPQIQCLPGGVNQVLLNMIVNAAHAIGETGAGRTSGLGSIRISAARDGDWVEIRIADSGAGIPEEIRERVFDQFFTTKGVGRGTGQGLSIAHAVIVGRHGGTIQFESEVGKGTTFVVRLPIARSPALAAA